MTYSTIKRKFKPNTPIVRVIIDGMQHHYEVFSVEGYLRKCRKDGKVAVYVGKTDSKGKLKIVEDVEHSKL